MSNQLNYYRSELKSKNIAKYKLIGINSELILNTSIFTKNDDIASFLSTVYDLQYKDYVFKSRTMILARTTRDIYKMDEKEFEISRKNLLLFINKSIEATISYNNIKSKNDNFGKWMDGITDGNY